MKEREMRPAVMDWCKLQGLIPVCEVFVGSHTADIVAVQFEERVGRRVPKVKLLVGIELKLTDYTGVTRQCVDLSKWCHMVHAVIPEVNIRKMQAKVLDRFVENKIGLLPFTSEGSIGVSPINSAELGCPVIKGARMDRFERNLWRRIVSGTTYVTDEQREQRYRDAAAYHNRNVCDCKYCLEARTAGIFLP